MSAQRQPLEPDLSGRTLDRYRLLRRLGMGGMGAVYEAEHTLLHKRVAVKLLHEDLARDEVLRRRFLREARAASSVVHPHIVGISDFGETLDGQVFLVMELLEGRDLQELLEVEGRLPWPRAREILLQVISALHAAHERGIVHRDIKPSNCFLAEIPGEGGRDCVKVLDFGIAKLRGRMGEATARLTSTDEIFGTVAYMAPEMAMGTNDDPRSDIYSVGVMMYRMLVGKVPFSEGNAFQILSQHVDMPPPRPCDEEPSISEDVEAIILRALAKQPSHRFPSMEAFGHALRRGSLQVTDVLVGVRTTVLGRLEPPAHAAPSALAQTTLMAPHEARAERARAALGVEEAPRPLAVVRPLVVRASPMEPGDEGPPSDGLERHASGTVVRPSMQRPPLAWLVLPVVTLAVLFGIVLVLVLPSGQDPASVTASGHRPAPSLDPPLAPLPATEPEPEPDESAELEIASDEPPAGIEGSSPPAEPEPVVGPEPSEVERRPRRPRPRRPRTDQEVAIALKAKIVARCKGDGDTTVKVEGVISSAGTIASPLITPPTGPGTCVKEVMKTAGFDVAGGVRSMPRFTVQL